MSTSDPAGWPPPAKAAFVQGLLCAADDDFLIGHRNSDWTGLAPMLEEDIAFSSIAQDEVAHARELYQIAGAINGESPDRIAYGRAARDYRCARLVYVADGFDWAVLIARQYLYDHFDGLRLERWRQSAHEPLAQVTHRIAAEERFHLHHVNDWLRRLSAGNADARTRIQQAIEKLWPLTPELFEEPAAVAAATTHSALPRIDASLWPAYTARIVASMEAAGLRPPADRTIPSATPPGGRNGRHAPELDEVLAELGEVFRLSPEAVW